jgi:hypothetical protein
MELELASLFKDPRGPAVANLAASLLVLIWTLGIDAKNREVWAWRGWVGFWIGTTVFYSLRSIDPSWDEIGVFVWLYLATFSLLLPLGTTNLVSRQRVILVIAIVATTAVADGLTIRAWRVAGWHQALTALAFLLWAWRIRSQDTEKSLVLIGYGIVQLPVAPFLSLIGIAGPDYETFVRSTYITYLALKIPLIPSIYHATQRRQEGS